MPADALNLIIRMKLHVNGKSHMKLYINRPNTKKADRRRRKKKEKRKEQESAAEAISGLKIVHYQHDL